MTTSETAALVRSLIKELPDHLHQLSSRKRLLKKVDLLVHEPLGTCGVLAVSRNVESLKAWPFILQSLGQLPAVHLRHHDVREEQMDPPMPSTGDKQRFSSAPSLQYGKSSCSKNPGRKPSHSL